MVIAKPASMTPQYLQIKEKIIEMILRGELKPGDRVFSENELVTQFGVSRMTANRALRELMIEGTLTRTAGLGTFVSMQRHDIDLLQIQNIAHEISMRGNQHKAEVQVAEIIPATSQVALSLNLEPGSDVMRTLIIHSENGQPIQLEERYVNPQIAPDYLLNDFTKVTPNEYLSALAPITEFEHFVEAILPNALIRKLLGVAKDQPCLRVFRRTWSGDSVVTCASLSYPGDRYRLEARSANAPKGKHSLIKGKFE